VSFAREVWNPAYLGVFEGVLGDVFRECEEVCVDGWMDGLICGSFDGWCLC
jgi:cytochrome c-type biogenesis protein CcmE